MPNATKTEHISNTFRGFVGLRIPASFHPHSFLLKKIVVRPLIGHNITQEPSDWPGRISHSPEALPEPGDRNNLEGTNQLAAMSNIQTEHNYIMVYHCINSPTGTKQTSLVTSLLMLFKMLMSEYWDSKQPFLTYVGLWLVTRFNYGSYSEYHRGLLSRTRRYLCEILTAMSLVS